jgi:signal transduction histidine kinase
LHPIRFVHQIITKQRAKRCIEVTLARIEYQGKPAWVTTSFDITERVEAEAALRKYSQRLELLSEVDRASLTARPVDEVARQALVLLRELIHCQRAAVVEVDLAEEELMLVAVYPDAKGPLAQGNRIPFSRWTDLSDRMAGQSLFVPDIGMLKSVTPVQRILLEHGVHSYFSVPLIAQGNLIGLLNVGAERPGAFSQDDRTIVAEVAARLAVAIQNARLFSEVMAGRRRLEELSLRLVQVQESERRYLARELHDEIAQTLTALRINLEMVEEHSRTASTTPLGQATSLVHDLFEHVRDLSLDLRPPMLDDLGLLPTCLWYFDRFTSQYGIPVNLDHRGVNTRFDPEVELVAYRIIQEALTNVARHAHADEVWVHLWVGPDSLNLQIEDQGRGFDVKEVLPRHSTSGLSGMMERARLVGGQFSIESESDRGTYLAVILPVTVPGGDELEGSDFDSHPIG